jgi:hypothetical protein
MMKRTCPHCKERTIRFWRNPFAKIVCRRCGRTLAEWSILTTLIYSLLPQVLFFTALTAAVEFVSWVMVGCVATLIGMYALQMVAPVTLERSKPNRSTNVNPPTES